jgi:hypothetical protein
LDSWERKAHLVAIICPRALSITMYVPPGLWVKAQYCIH